MDPTPRTASGDEFPSYDEMPEDNEDLAKVQVSFPYLPDNSAESCPVSIKEIIGYLASEVPDGESLTPDDLHFIRTAQVGEQRFWIWRFTDPEGAEWYVTVSQDPEGSLSIISDENSYGLSPEQFMLGVYHQVF